jgi:hypothetical protein
MMVIPETHLSILSVPDDGYSTNASFNFERNHQGRSKLKDAFVE